MHKRYKIPKEEHTRFYGRQGDRNPQFIIFPWEIQESIKNNKND